MKNYLILLKNMLIKNKSIDTSKANQSETQDSRQSEKPKDDYTKIIDIANSFGLEITMHSLRKKLSKEGINCYCIDENNMIFFYPVNDGKPTCPFEFYKDGKLILHNQNVYSEITNLDEIILQIVRIFNKSLDEGIVIDPYYFMLKLDDEIKENYKGMATLVITEKAIRNQKLNEQNFNEANKYYINHFLDHFIGWNFGVSVNRNETLKNELEVLNEKVNDMGIREYAGSGYDVYGVESEAYHGLQHYRLPIKNNSKKLKNKNL